MYVALVFLSGKWNNMHYPCKEGSVCNVPSLVPGSYQIPVNDNYFRSFVEIIKEQNEQTEAKANT